MAVDIFIKIDGIEGESHDDKHKNEIDVQSFSFGLSQTGSYSAGGGGGVGKASFQDVHFTKHSDKSSPKLFLASASGEHIKKAEVTFRKAGKEQQEYFKITLSDVLVSSYQVSDSQGGTTLPSESVSLNFAKIEFDYKEQKADGTLGGSVKTGWDVKANKKV
ncbi:type VI secretion system tube protein Hcp [uncultured Rhodoblastus sp.]|uniref:Hcp family type VI secretion system effector n=1 Tax=uncultured Rhodoblastus sp. TaxID=543037 RepID=UPI0025DE8576|nr:type VI secretion system tube protein Hcp [uncultured Rhodoblastus sp.]